MHCMGTRVNGVVGCANKIELEKSNQRPAGAYKGTSALLAMLFKIKLVPFWCAESQIFMLSGK
eukprot:scaffold230287_cov10-Tisochrysis_lutea.AAC.1